jgi:hypothetical protein
MRKGLGHDSSLSVRPEFGRTIFGSYGGLVSTPLEAREKLEDYGRQLDTLSRSQQDVADAFEIVDTEYQRFVDDFEIGLYLKSEEKDGPKLPSEAMRLKLARHNMPAEILGRRDALLRQQAKAEKRIGHLKALVDAQRSILSALKSELEASS